MTSDVQLPQPKRPYAIIRTIRRNVSCALSVEEDDQNNDIFTYDSEGADCWQRSCWDRRGTSGVCCIPCAHDNTLRPTDRE